MKLCFVGDSLIEYHDWHARFPKHAVVNLGVSGETASELLVRVPYLDVAAGGPDAVVLMTGTNDILMDADFLPAYGQIVSTLRQILPQATILLCGLLPMPLPWLAPRAIAQANEALAALALGHGAEYLDGTILVPDEAASRLFFLDDGVHLTPHGYAVWSAAIAQRLNL